MIRFLVFGIIYWLNYLPCVAAPEPVLSDTEYTSIPFARSHAKPKREKSAHLNYKSKNVPVEQTKMIDKTPSKGDTAQTNRKQPTKEEKQNVKVKE